MNNRIVLIYKYLRFVLIVMLMSSPLMINAQSDTLEPNRNEVDGNIRVGILNILTEPESGAAVFIDDILSGYTPFLKNIAIGNHKLCLKKEQYYDYCEYIVVSDSKMVKKVKMDLMFGYIKVSSTPTGALVYINDVETKLPTPCTTGKIDSGSARLTLKLDDYQTFDTIIKVDDNSIHRLHVNLVKSVHNNDMPNEEYISQLYSDTTKLTTMLASDYITSQLADSANVKQKNKHKSLNKSKARTAFFNKIERENGLGSGLWFKIGSGLSCVWDDDLTYLPEGYDYTYPTFYVGGQFTYRFSRFIGLGIDLFYARNGYKTVYYVGTVKYTDKFIFNDIDFPILAKIFFLKNGLGPMIEIGPIIDYRINYTRTRDSGIGEAKIDKLSYNALNFGVVGGIGGDFKIGKVICTANMRAIVEFTKIFDNSQNKMLYFQVGLGIKFY